MSHLYLNHPSPHFNQRPLDTPIKYLILHYTACDFQTALNYLTKSQRPNRVSAHYLVDTEGTIYSLVPESKRAWHAGPSRWEQDENLNNSSIGIEIVNLGVMEQPLPPYPIVQMQAVKSLCLDILKRHGILPCYVLGHSDICVGRKADPGEHFDWPGLSEAGIGLYPKEPVDLKKCKSVLDYQKQLHDYGYDCPLSGVLDTYTLQNIQAFQRHFSPKRIDGKIHDEDYSKIIALNREKT